MLRKLLGRGTGPAIIGGAAGVAYASPSHGDSLEKVKQATAHLVGQMDG